MADATILVIEDNPLNMELVTDLLDLHGYAVLQAMDAEEGIKVAGNAMPDLILMDISLPGMDGLQATQLLKADEKTAIIPIVAVTAHAMKGDEQQILATGCEGYITKPIDTRSFAEDIARYLR